MEPEVEDGGFGRRAGDDEGWSLIVQGGCAGGNPRVAGPECGVVVVADGPTDSGVEGSSELLWGDVSWEGGIVEDGPLVGVEVAVSRHHGGGDRFDLEKWMVCGVCNAVAM